jgi:LPXTG-site transpeptidase (sortase) family protein
LGARRLWPRLAVALPLPALAALLIWINAPRSPAPIVREPPATPTPAVTPTPTALPNEEVVPVVVPPASATETPVPTYYAPMPVRFVVPRLGIDAPIATGGLDESGKMQDPNGPEEVMWYNFSPTPGSNGNALVSGHRDYAQSGRGARAAVFWTIPELQPGDEVYVRDETDEDLRFIVEETVSYETDQVPLEEVQAQGFEKVLTIITCEGYFNPRTRDYDHRRIVRARLA